MWNFLKLNKYICYELNKAYLYQGENPIFVLWSNKNQWIWKIYMESQWRLWFYFISFVDVMVTPNSKLVPCALELYLRADYPKDVKNYLIQG